MKKHSDNISWEEVINSIPEGKVTSVGPKWSEDNYRTKMFRMARKGYFTRVTARERRNGAPFGDYFERTAKKFVPGDGPKKPIAYSFNTQNQKQ